MTPFPTVISTTTGEDPFTQMFGSGTFVKNLSNSELLDRAKLNIWFRQQDGVAFKEVPYPENDDGQKLPHGAILDFTRVPIRSNPNPNPNPNPRLSLTLTLTLA